MSYYELEKQMILEVNRNGFHCRADRSAAGVCDQALLYADKELWSGDPAVYADFQVCSAADLDLGAEERHQARADAAGNQLAEGELFRRRRHHLRKAAGYL